QLTGSSRGVRPPTIGRLALSRAHSDSRARSGTQPEPPVAAAWIRAPPEVRMSTMDVSVAEVANIPSDAAVPGTVSEIRRARIFPQPSFGPVRSAVRSRDRGIWFTSDELFGVGPADQTINTEQPATRVCWRTRRLPPAGG